MIDLKQYISEGGASGHLSHIIDYDDMTLDDLKGLMYSLFNGRVKDITEKIDGTNIQASMNHKGEVIFVRNSKDLNSERGGMSIEDMVAKWAGKDRVQRTFVESGEALQEVFLGVGEKFFNPNDHTRIFANCECMIEGTTNIMPYISSKVFVHDLWVYEQVDGRWEHTDTTKKGLDKLERAMEQYDRVAVTPNVIVDVTEKGKDLCKRYMVELNKMFKEYGLRYKNTIDDYKRARFEEWCRDNAGWVFDNEQGVDIMYDRIIHGNKSYNISNVKRDIYPDHAKEVGELDKNKDVYAYCLKDIDALFLRMSNDIIAMCKDFINAPEGDKVVGELWDALNATVEDIESDSDVREETKTKLMQQLQRLEMLGSVNPTEGIVFRYKGRLMKCTGSFAPLNQILGSIKFNR